MKKEEIYLTQEGLEKLKKEYDELVTTKRRDVIERIAHAREFGDISENSEYDLAREEQSFVEGRIIELEEVLKHARVIEDSGTEGISKIVSLGSKVKIHIDGDDEEFIIVDAPEADPSKRYISHDSPLGRALMGRKAGEKVEVEAPIGKLTYAILAVG
ncbi:MAG: transcription elongation factor GreA [Patescibacteria group bacterium]|nr:transcription elongation factor GreA [Patescibacteria group bacterium]